MDTRRSAFTLIELLVVIAVIGLLLSILLPALRAAKATAKQIISAGRMRQIGIALQIYAEDNRGSFPRTTHNELDIDRCWIYTLAPYVGNVDEIRICPADPKKNERLDNNASSFIMNEYVMADVISPFGEIIDKSPRFHELRNPGTTITTFVIADDRDADPTLDHTHSRGWFEPGVNSWDTLCYDIQPDRYCAGSKAEDKTRGSSNYLFADTHVEKIKAATIKEWADSNRNFAKPN